MQSIQEIKGAFQNGDISREDFWRAMQERHLRLREYQRLIGSGEVAAIEITVNELRVATSAGVKMVWYPEDLRTAPDVLVNTGAYEPVESAALMRAIGGARVIFDVGANVGFYSLHWARQLPEGACVHAFEPVPATYQRLVRNVELNDLACCIKPRNFGLSAEAGTLAIYLPSFSGSSASSLKNLHPEEESVQVDVQLQRLDDYFTEAGLDALDFVKIDVEGAELLVLQGALKTIAEHKPLLFMELLRKWSKPFGYHPNDVITLLGQLGYGCYAYEDGQWRRFAEMDDRSPQTNFFFAHTERHREWLAVAAAAYPG